MTPEVMDKKQKAAIERAAAAAGARAAAEAAAIPEDEQTDADRYAQTPEAIAAIVGNAVAVATEGVRQARIERAPKPENKTRKAKRK